MAFRLANLDGRAVLIDGAGWHDLAAASDGAFSGDPMEAVRRHAELHAVSLDGRTPDGAVAEATFDTPVPTPRSVFAVGLNYADHAGEADMDLPENPLVFTKFPSCLAGPTADVVLNAGAADYEAELVVVIGKEAFQVAREHALKHVYGYTCGNDVSARDWQKGRPGGQWLLGKTFDTFAPLGPWIVTADELGDPHRLPIRFELNGEPMQSGDTSQLLFTIDVLIAHLSKFMTLVPGDLIFTGTPAGVGAGRKPPLFLQPGDQMKVTIEGIGSLANPVVASGLKDSDG